MKQKTGCLVVPISILLAAFAARIVFWMITDWTVEDAMIYARISRNFVETGILGYNPGVKVSAATSTFFALLTSGLTVCGLSSLCSAKILGLLCGSLCSLVVYMLLRPLASIRIAMAGGCFVAFLPPMVAYSVGGMETPLYTLACLLALWCAVKKSFRAAFLWAALAFLLRPDGALVGLVVFVFAWVTCERKARRVFAYGWPAAAICVAALSAHWWYYGAFVPQSLSAKSAAYDVDPASNFLRYLDRMVLSQPGAWVFYGLMIVGIVQRWRKRCNTLILAAWYVLYHIFFVTRAPLFDWYLQPPLFVLCFFSALGLGQIVAWMTERFHRSDYLPAAEALGAIALALSLAVSLWPYGIKRVANQQYELKVRAAAGRWLAANAKPSSLVFTESLGFIGYYCPNPFIDWPGLVSREASKIIKDGGLKKSRRRAYDAIISHFSPEWLVLRFEEWPRLEERLKSRYVQVVRFDPPNDSGVGYLIAHRQM
jgi:4-amino-4-deoxy-L-arabinose transferase-like glycosyltransferase